jgi:type IV secretory pathway VirB2 component (pilin)
VLYVLVLVAAVVCADVLFFRHHFTERLIANAGIVLVFGASYLWFAKPRSGGRSS